MSRRLSTAQFFPQDVVMAKEDTEGNKVLDACFNCCANWSETHPGRPWSECCQRSLSCCVSCNVSDALMSLEVWFTKFTCPKIHILFLPMEA